MGGELADRERRRLGLTGHRLIETAASLERGAVGVGQGWVLPPGVLTPDRGAFRAGVALGPDADGGDDSQLVGMPVDGYEFTVEGGGSFGCDPLVTLMGQPCLQQSPTSQGDWRAHGVSCRRSPATRATPRAAAETTIESTGRPYSSQGFTIVVSRTLYAKRAAPADRPAAALTSGPAGRVREGGIG